MGLKWLCLPSARGGNRAYALVEFLVQNGTTSSSKTEPPLRLRGEFLVENGTTSLPKTEPPGFVRTLRPEARTAGRYTPSRGGLAERSDPERSDPERSGGERRCAGHG